MDKEKISIKEYNFEVNALYAKDALDKLGITTYIKDIDGKHFELFCEASIKEKALKELDALNLDESPVHKDSEGYLEEVDEWSKHMYNPIYWLERKKYPHFFYGKSMKLILGMLLLAPALGIFII